MREFVDSALTQYSEYVEKYRGSVGGKLFFEWKALVICLFLAVLPEGRKQFNSAGELLQYLEDLLLGYYAEAGEEEGIVSVTGYMLLESSISCFSVYSLYIYMHMEHSGERKTFYRTMIELPFRHECAWGEKNDIPSDIARSYLSEDLDMETESGMKNIREQNGKTVRKTFRRFVRLKKYDENMNDMEIVKAESNAVEAFFL